MFLYRPYIAIHIDLKWLHFSVIVVDHDHIVASNKHSIAI